MTASTVTFERKHSLAPTTESFWGTIFLVIALAHIIAVLAMPIIYDTMHLGDTLFLLNEGRRVLLGLAPGVDYQSFYGGLAPWFLSLSFRVFGLEVRAIDLVVLLHLAVVLPLALIVLRRRAGQFTTLAMMALLATCLLTRAPLEEYVALIQPVSAHSFSYNRLGLAFSLVSLLFVLLPTRPDRNEEMLGGLASGAALGMALLCKWSFAIMPPFVLLALALQRRWTACLSLLAATVLCWFLFDPFGRQFLGTLAYMQAAAAAADGLGGLSGLIFKSVNTILSHVPVLLAMGVGIVVAARALHPRERIGWLAAAVVMVAAFGAACLVMGPFGLIGHQILPVAAAILLICFERARQREDAGEPVQKVLALIVLFAFLLPHLANTMAITATGFAKRDEALIAEGPMKGYLQRYDAGNAREDLRAVIAYAADRIAADKAVARPMEYPVFVDGLSALSHLGDLSRHGVIADGLFNYEFAVGSAPVLDYPLWPRPSSPELRATTGIPAEADIVMILRHDAGALGSILRKRMGAAFVPCLQTGIWSVFARTGANVEGCKVL